MNSKKTAFFLNQLGSSLVEILIAVAIVGTTLTAIAAALTHSVKTNAQAKYRELAAQQAQNLVEVFRRERSILGWETFYSQLNNGTYCYNTLPAAGAGFTIPAGQCVGYDLVITNLGVAFNREIVVTKNADSVTVAVEVAWPGEGVMEHRVSSVNQFKKY